MSAHARRWSPAAILLSLAFLSISFVPAFAWLAPGLWAIALLGMTATLVFVIRVDDRRSARRSGPHRRFFVLAGLFTAAVVLSATLVSSGSAKAASEAGLEKVAVDVTSPSLSPQLLAATAALEANSGRGAEQLIRQAAQRRVQPRSGLAADFDSAEVFHNGGTDIVSVPLIGSDVPEVSHLTFLISGKSMTVTEMAARMTSATSVHWVTWIDGVQERNVEIDKTPEGATSEVSTKGFSMATLQRCLNSAGINWAVVAIVGVACAAACATAVLCAPCIALNAGLVGGTVGKCVQYAFA